MSKRPYRNKTVSSSHSPTQDVTRPGVNLSYSAARIAAFCYMGLPFIIFSMTWLRFWVALLSTTVTLFILFLVIKPNFITNIIDRRQLSKKIRLNPLAVDHIRISYGAALVVFLIACLWVFWSGIGGGFYQSGDFPYRNAVFRDLITHKWPVIYGKEKGMLAYYIGFWLPAASFGKIVGLFTNNSAAIWSLSNAALYLWTVIGVVLVLLMLYFNVNATNSKKILAATCIFVFFSGMDIVGWLAAGTDGFFARMVDEKIHIEWWAKKISFPSGHLLQYSSFTTQLFWVFNQAVVTWLAILTLFRENTPQNFIFIGMMSLFCGPIPFYGFLIIALTRGILFIYRGRKHLRFTVGEFFSISNLLSLIGIFPVCWAYFTGNSAATLKSGSKLLRFVPRLLFNVDGKAHTGLDGKRLLLFISFLALEFLLIALIIWWHNRRDLTFWVCMLMLCVFPMIFTGAAADFCMRATIPALVLFCVYVIRFVFDKINSAKKSADRLLCYVLITFLLLGAATPIVEMSRGFYMSKKAGHFVTYNDTFKSLGSDEKSADSIKNFTSQNYINSTFYKYFARR